MMVIFVAHANVKNGKSLFIGDGAKFVINDGIFAGLAIFHHQCNFHRVPPECRRSRLRKS
ncbi:hypothetical protein LTSEALA_1739 [Salmonella enterica subsp. enterica serovar Alachua str. R6-377]|uniref:Uncharacterized protein n=1 Tax=Salmonella enterica subsp. enterica serovar Alachua str. R6-377 TaxID=913241 RepID=G5LMG7_SALET|nr:hypothetical protein LTSEALA_1739 [Salmonella enterica subsp. enterica serovar Alachua str. R6-377]